MHINNWNGELSLSSPFKANQQKELPQIEFQLAYATVLPISKAKYNDLQVLKKICSLENQAYVDFLPKSNDVPDTLHEVEEQHDD